MKSSNWFEVDKAGFQALQSGKPKYHAVRELIQNALDEDVKRIIVTTHYDRGNLDVCVEDDGGGFRDIKDAYTLFADTYKRPDATKRGRFNLGEKQAFAICKSAEIKTTSGTIVFDENGRHRKREKTEKGTVVQIFMTKVTREEYEEILDFFKLLIVPPSIDLVINEESAVQRTPTHTFQTKLQTEYLKDGEFKPTKRITDVELFDARGRKAYLYEMGIPVCEIDCKYHINVQQRVPMSMDRDKVSESYLQDIFAEVLNNTFEELNPEESSETWVRMATSDDRISKDAIKTVVEKRYGDKVVVATPSDRLSVDDAKAHGFNILHGSMLSADEWEQMRKHDAIQSSHDMFGKTLATETDYITPNQEMKRVGQLAKKIARHIFGIEISVVFVDSNASHRAYYGGRQLIFNVRRLPPDFFQHPLDEDVLEIIIHELGHEKGMHTEIAYHQALCQIGSALIMEEVRRTGFLDEFKNI